jgi:hypothetical protein
VKKRTIPNQAYEQQFRVWKKRMSIAEQVKADRSEEHQALLRLLEAGVMVPPLKLQQAAAASSGAALAVDRVALIRPKARVRKKGPPVRREPLHSVRSVVSGGLPGMGKRS